MYRRLAKTAHENPLARFQWGIRPPNSKRRRRVAISVSAPLVSYLIFLVVVVLLRSMDARILSVFGSNDWIVNGTAIVYYLGTAWVWLLISIYVIGDCISRRTAHAMRTNWEEYYLAGLEPSQVIAAARAPLYMGMVRMIILHYSLAGALALLSIGVNPSFFRYTAGEISIAFVLVFTAPIWVFMAGSMANVGLTLATRSRVLRAAIVIFVFYVAGILVHTLTVFALLRGSSNPSDMFGVHVLLYIASWIVRAVWARSIWEKGMRRIGPEEVRTKSRSYGSSSANELKAV